MNWVEFFRLFRMIYEAENILYLGNPEIVKELASLKKNLTLITPEELKIKTRRIKYIKENPMNISIEKSRKFDLVINNLPLDIIGSFSILKNFCDNFRKNGKLLMHLKVQNKLTNYAKRLSKEFLGEMGIKEVGYLKIDNKLYLIGEKV